MKPTAQICDEIIALLDEINRRDKESAGAVLISIIAQKSGYNPLQADSVLCMARQLLNEELKVPHTVESMINEKELIN